MRLYNSVVLSSLLLVGGSVKLFSFEYPSYSGLGKFDTLQQQLLTEGTDRVHRGCSRREAECNLKTTFYDSGQTSLKG